MLASTRVAVSNGAASMLRDARRACCTSPRPRAKSDLEGPSSSMAALELAPTPIEGFDATDFLLSSAERAAGCQSVAKQLFDLGTHTTSQAPDSPGSERPSRTVAQASSTSRNLLGHCPR